MYKDLKTLHPGGIQTRDFHLEVDAMTTMPRRQGRLSKMFAFNNIWGHNLDLQANNDNEVNLSRHC
jgi:hypothetical protein